MVLYQTYPWFDSRKWAKPLCRKFKGGIEQSKVKKIKKENIKITFGYVCAGRRWVENVIRERQLWGEPNFKPVWPDGENIFSIFGHFQKWKFSQWHTKFAKVGTEFCQKLNLPLKIAKVAKFCQILSLCFSDKLKSASWSSYNF